MVKTCCVKSCKSENFTNCGISFHRFPKEPDIKEKWIDVTGRGHWFPTKTSSICSKHFSGTDYIVKKSGHKYLRAGAIPTENIVRVQSSYKNTWASPRGYLVEFGEQWGLLDIGLPKEGPSDDQSCATRIQRTPATFTSFPHDPITKEKWIAATGRKDWFPTKHSTICSKHFENSSFIEGKKLRFLKKTAYPTINILKHIDNDNEVTETAQPGPSKIQDTRTPIDSGSRHPPHTPQSQVVQQCRFCGEFSKDCVDVSSDMTYLAGNKTTLALNDASVQLDFNDRSRPKTVCRHCDAKLQEFCDFVNVVKAAQCTLNYVAVEQAQFEQPTAEFEETAADFAVSTAEYEDIEILVVKTEDSDDNKEGIVDPLAVGETVCVIDTHKRKSDTNTAKPKKLKAKEKCDDDLVIAIKEEVVEKDTNEPSEVSDTGTDIKPSELELARSDLVFKMAGDVTCEYQGYRSDR